MIDPVIELSIRLGLALLFASAAWHKLRDRSRFIAALRAYRLLPSSLVAPVGWVLPIAEVFIAVGFLYPPAREAAAFAAVPLLMLYTLAIGANLALGRRDIDCGCVASRARVPLSGWLVARNALLMLAACSVIAPVRPRAFLWIDVLTVMAVFVTLPLLWIIGERLARTGAALRQLGGNS